MQEANPPGSMQAHEAFALLGRVNLTEESMSVLLQRVVDLAAAVLPGADSVSISLVTNDRQVSAAHTDSLAQALDKSQFGCGYGPCLEAAAAGEITEIIDGRGETRWPAFIRQFVECGARSSISVPVPVIHHVTAALNVYARRPHAFGPADKQVAVEFAGYAGVAVANMHSFEGMRTLAHNLQIAMDTRAVIEQAKGILLERYKLTPEAAFKLLSSVSMRSNRKLYDIADDLVRTGDFAIQLK